MLRYRRLCLPAVAVILVLVFTPPARAEGTAPDFKLSNLEGKDIVLSDLLRQGPVIVDFWATWCKPCLKAFPGLQGILDRYRDRGLSVVAVSVDSPKSRSRVGPLIKSKKYTFEVLLDTEGRVAKKYNAFMLPRTVLVNQDGEVILAMTGYRPSNHERLAEVLASLLPEKPAKDGGPVE
jgi:cytochrome c biogenesis protein CcmG/thiol:disulfide interchange protein DsbE